jgi:hypothetical protein
LVGLYYRYTLTRRVYVLYRNGKNAKADDLEGLIAERDYIIQLLEGALKRLYKDFLVYTEVGILKLRLNNVKVDIAKLRALKNNPEKS